MADKNLIASKPDSLRHLTRVVTLLFGLISFFVIVNGRFFLGQNDFVGLYIGGVQVGTSHLYSYAENQVLVSRLIHAHMHGTGFVRPPFYAALLRPLALLPYPVAYWVFQLAMVAALAWFVRRFSRECPELAIYACFTPAVITALANGQDTPLFLVAAASYILLFRSGRHFMGGLILSFCSVKFHLFVLIPVLLSVKRHWRTMAGMVTGGSILLAFGAVCAGLDSYGEWINMLRNPVVSPSGTMTNIHVLIETYHGSMALEITAVLAVVALFVWMCWKTEEFEFLFGVALIAGLLINVHSYVWDSILLLLAFVLIKNTKLRLALSVLLTPIAYYLLFGPSTRPYILALLVVLVLAAISLLIKEKGAVLHEQHLPPSGIDPRRSWSL